MLGLVPKHTRGAEIGVCLGDFSREILKAVDPELLVLIDVWQHIDLGYQDKLMGHNGIQLKRYRAVCREFGLDTRVKIIRDLSAALSLTIPEKHLDWIYIDGDHSYRGCRADLDIADTLVKDSGLIMGHDYDPLHPGVIQAVDEFVAAHGYHMILTTQEKCPSYMIAKTVETYQQIIAQV